MHDGVGLLRPVPSVSETLAHKSDGAHLFMGYVGALVPTKQQHPTRSRESSRISKHG